MLFLRNNPGKRDSPFDGVDDLVVGVGLGELDPLGVVAAHQEAVGQRAQQVLQQRRRHEHAALTQVNLLININKSIDQFK